MQTKRDNMSLGAAGLAEGTNAGTLKTSNILHYIVKGRAYIKAVTDNIAFALMTKVPALAILPLTASQVGVFFISVRQSDGALVYEQSASKPSATGAGYQAGAFEWPSEVEGHALIGAIKVATNASGAFTAATTDLGAANQTVTYYDVAVDYGIPIPY